MANAGSRWGPDGPTGSSPLDRVQAWYELARAEGVPEPEAAALATATPDGRPSVRMVLVRGIEACGIAFYTNRESRKGRELAANPYAALVFPWHSLHRQVRLSGPVEVVEEAVSDAYFTSRPYGARIAARVSRQSQVISGRTELEADWAAQARAYPEGGDVPRPARWQGYRVRPDSVEFWSGRENRLHDRLRFRHTEDGWVTERLAP